MTAMSVEKKVNGTPATSPEPRFDPRALAEAEAIRTEAAAKADAIRTEAQGRADAERVLAAEQAEALRLENEKQQVTLNRNQLRYRREESEQLAKIAKADRDREDIERVRDKARRDDEEQRQAEDQSAKDIQDADEKWRSYAIRFAIVCGIVSLPVQMSFFWNPSAPWMAAAPIMLEGAAWVVHRGARAAAVSKRPVWHYRTIVWLLAFIAAGVNLYHGLHSFDPGTAIATAFASIAGPGVWDLHEHGRIRKRDGELTRRERKAQRRNMRAEAVRKAAEEKRVAAEKEATKQAAEEAAAQLAGARAEEFPEVWEEAEKIAAAVGEVTVTEAVWARAYRNIQGCDPGESIESITSRRKAEARVEAALTGAPVSRGAASRSAQVDQQMPPRPGRGHAGGPTVRGTRQKGDTQKYSPGARKQASLAAKNATEKKG
ncbi:hypothetical protein [Streptomyces sp. NPDC088736]|uniref:hypothetical protein n=1 Tax=Streptomyces sp. NPDC088736 TaxID=3365881 RepID=UPI00380CC2AD